ncbi:MAG: hypothetical protein K2X03_29145 [Bryobacteraceae bacterium]|nr:hypothetical protein [Bryobacteraceae bacterium]
MSTFDGATGISTRVDISGDAFTPNMGSLVGSSFKEDTKIMGTRNEMVLGDITLKFMANVTKLVFGNCTATVMGNKSHTTMGTSMKTIMGVYTKMMMSVYNRQVMSSEMKLTIGPTLKTILGPVTCLNPTVSMFNSGDWFETKWTKGAAYLFRTTNVGADVAIRGTNTQVALFEVLSKGIQSKVDGLKNATVAGLKNGLVACCIAVEAVRSDINGIHPDVRGVRPAIGCELNVPPDTIPGLQ